jgi:hypothetical protein
MASGNGTVDPAVGPTRGGGPKTEEGKARSSRNALKHGLRAVKHVFSDEDAELFQEYRIELMNELRPVGTVETALADRVAQSIWRLRRIMSIEAEMFDHERRRLDGSLSTVGEVFARPQFGGTGGVLKLIRYETSLQRSLERSLRLLREEQAARRELEEAGEGESRSQAARSSEPPPAVERGAGPASSGRDEVRRDEPGGIDPTQLREISKRTPGLGHNGSRTGGIPPTQRV